jgi:hypothetical protein
VVGPPKAAPAGPPGCDAQKSSSKKFMPIKHLHENDGSVTVPVRVLRAAPGAVEFLPRAATGLAGD